jgi:hypothetical protein
MKRITIILMGLLPATGLVQAATRQAFLPLPVRQSLIAMAKTCTDAGGTPGKSSGVIQYADLNGDGTDDYVFDQAAFICEGATSATENGQAGAEIAIFVGGSGNGAVKVYSNNVYGNHIDRSHSPARLYIDVAAQLCGQRDATRLPFARWEFCSRPLNWNAAKHAFVLAPLSEKRPVPQQ